MPLDHRQVFAYNEKDVLCKLFVQSASEVSAITRQQYLAELRSYLQFMETEERDAVLREYTEKFEAAEDETTLLANLESPMRVAIALRKSYAPIRVPTDVGEPRNQGHTAGETISAPETDVAEEAPAAEVPTEADVTDETPEEEAPAEEEGSDLTEADAALEQQVSGMVAAILAEHLPAASDTDEAGPTEEQPTAEPAEEAPAVPDETDEVPEEAPPEATAAPEVEESPVSGGDSEAEDQTAMAGFPMEAEIICPREDGSLPAEPTEILTQELDSTDAPQDTAPSGRVLPEEPEPVLLERRPGAFAGHTILAVVGGLLLLLVGAAILFGGLFFLDVGLRNQAAMLADALLLYATACLCLAAALPVVAAAVRLSVRRILRMKKRCLDCLAEDDPGTWRHYWRVIVILVIVLVAAAVALVVVALLTGGRFPRAFANVQHMLQIIDWAHYRSLIG